MANLATLSDDGPRNAPVWFVWEDGAIWLLGSKNGSSVRGVLSDPRCAVEVVRFENEAGVLLHLGMRGSATVEAMDANRFRRLLAKYLGADETSWNSWFIDNVAAIEDPDGRIRLVPETTFTNNVTFFRTGPALAWPTET